MDRNEGCFLKIERGSDGLSRINKIVILTIFKLIELSGRFHLYVDGFNFF